MVTAKRALSSRREPSTSKVELSNGHGAGTSRNTSITSNTSLSNASTRLAPKDIIVCSVGVGDTSSTFKCGICEAETRPKTNPEAPTETKKPRLQSPVKREMKTQTFVNHKPNSSERVKTSTFKRDV